MSTTSIFTKFAGRLREFIVFATEPSSSPGAKPRGLAVTPCPAHDDILGGLARELFELQFDHNPAYRGLCEARQVSPRTLEHWTQIPAAPTAAFKELDLTCLPTAQRETVFHSSGTTAHKPSRHYHNAESLGVYEDSLWAWFRMHFQIPVPGYRLVILTPSPPKTPHSSLVHMFEVIRRRLGSHAEFFADVLDDGAWRLDLAAIVDCLNKCILSGQPVLLCGTAFSHVHLLDYLIENDLRLLLPPGSRVLETGGYKSRSRSLPKAELYSLITGRLGTPFASIVSEYGMSELSSQAYDHVLGAELHFPPWARAQIVSPETGLEVEEGETGLIRVFDLANVSSVLAIQTEDLAMRRGSGFELFGRAPQAEPRGCSLMLNS